MRGLTVASLVIVGLIGPALAHSWYDWDCCHDQDCRPIAMEEVEEIDHGQWRHIASNTVIEKVNVRPSRDGQFHLCTPHGVPKCLYIVSGS